MTLPFIVLATAISYPATRTDDLVEKLHGVEVADPYRWLEDDRSEETTAWVKAQNEVTGKFLSSLPTRPAIHQRLTRLIDFERIGAPREYGGRWFFTYNSGLQNQSVLMTSTTLGGEPSLLLDPNTLSDDGTVSLANWSPSEDGKRLAWSISRGGSDWNEIFIRDVETGKDLPDHLRWVKFSGISWLPDGSGFLYSRYDAPAEGGELTASNKHHQIWFHKVGTAQAEDKLIYRRQDQPTWNFYAGVTEDGRYLVIHVADGTSTNNRIFYQNLTEPGKTIELLPDADASYRFLGNIGTRFYFRTNLDAPRHRVISIDLTRPTREHWQEILPQTAENLDDVSLVGRHLIASYLKDARSLVRIHDLTGKAVREVALPGLGTASGFGGRIDDTHTFYSFSSFTDPGAIHRYEIATGKSELWRKPDIDFDGSAYETRQVFIPSRDGTRVPAFIVHKKGLKLDGSHRTLLYGYGGFNIPQTPGFSLARAVWLERGGIFVLACIRGGGEYGKEWHEAATKLGKQKSYDDFIAIAEWLIAENYTSSKKLAIQGGSNGGLLVGACMTQRPELFGACLPAVGVMDLLRFHKFTIGWAWKKDYGDPEDPEEFSNLLKISPYHQLKPGVRYPATLVTTADHDDRVVPAHSFKFAARLQACQPPDGPPVLIRIDTSAGHGAGTALSKMIDLQADQLAFLEAALR